jgi:predicted transcriptional regulator
MAQPGRKPTVSDNEILRQFMLSPDPFLHPTELTEPLDMSRQGVFKRLKGLEERGLLDSKKTGGTRNFWITDEGKSYVASDA